MSPCQCRRREPGRGRIGRPAGLRRAHQEAPDRDAARDEGVGHGVRHLGQEGRRRQDAMSPSSRATVTPKLKSLRVRELTKRFADAAAVRGFDLEVSGGEFISLLGPSGCGKTTTLNCIAGLLEPDKGAIEIDGRDITREPPERRGFGMVFQNYALFPHLDVSRNVGFGLEVRGIGRSEIGRRVARALELVQLGALGKRYPAQLSGGQQQRVALARAIVTEPPLILMDEPLSNLDAKLRLEMRLEIRRLHQSLGLTTIYVTHDQEAALALAEFVGDGFELSADAGAGQRFIARTTDRWAVGDQVALRLPPERLLVFPSEVR